MAAKHAVRVTQEPRVVRKVDDAELLDLSRQGLIYSSESGDHGSHKWEPETVETETVEAPDPTTATKASTKKKGE